VLFHFKRKDQLGLALLDRVLASTMLVEVPADIRAIPSPQERFQALFSHELRRFSQEPRWIRLLLEYWARGTHNAVIRGKIGQGLDAYRAAFRQIAEEMVRAAPGPAAGATPAGMAAAAVSLILGYPVQAIIDPDQPDMGEYLASGESVSSPRTAAA
jgi:AcrR family transcriptional regulator